MMSDKEIEDILSKYRMVDMYGKKIKAVSTDLVPIIGKLADYVYESGKDVDEFIVHDITTGNCYYFSKDGMYKIGPEDEKEKVREALK